VKRLFDIILSIILLVVLSPLFILVAILVWIFIGRPIFFTQIRPGLDEKSFLLVKFRTMTNERDKNGNYLPNNLRVTKFGNFLRKTSLDELPEFWNVLKGDMSLVGPRPLLVEYLPLYNSQQRRRHKVRPGITGWAQINGRNCISWSERLCYDTWYVDHYSLRLDMKILWRTFWKVLIQEGAVLEKGETTMTKFTGNTRVLILGGGWDQLPIIQKARDRGFDTILVDGDEDCIGRQYSDEFHKVSTRDYKKIYELAKTLKVNAVTYMITESPIYSAYYSGQRLGIPHPSRKSVDATFSKLKMREILTNSGVPEIKFFRARSLDEAIEASKKITFPLIMKSADVGGQLGLFLVKSVSDVEKNFERSLQNSVDGEVILEEFVDGPEVNGVAIILNGEVREMIASDRIKSNSEGFGIVQRHLYPSKHVSKSELISYTKKIVEALEIENAIIFPQFLIGQQGIRLCEIGERVPGGVMKELFEFSTGIDLVDLQLDISLGQVRSISHYKRYHHYPAVTVKFINAVNNQLLTGKLISISGEKSALNVPGVLKVETYNDPNLSQSINYLSNARDRFYFVISGGETTDFVIRSSNAASCFLSFERDDGKEMNLLPYKLEA